MEKGKDPGSERSASGEEPVVLGRLRSAGRALTLAFAGFALLQATTVVTVHAAPPQKDLGSGSSGGDSGTGGRGGGNTTTSGAGEGTVADGGKLGGDPGDRPGASDTSGTGSGTTTDPGKGGAGDSGTGDGSSDGGVDPVDVTPGSVVGVFVLDAPSFSPFTLRGTLPLPRGLYSPGSGDVPFIVLDSAGDAYPTQVEIVSRYAAAADGADVVEILARVPRSAGVQTGARIEYQVSYVPHAAGTRSTPASVESFLDAPGALVLQSKDGLGNLYQADLLADDREGTSDLRVLKDGEIAREVRTHEVLLPVSPQSGPNATLPHLMGVHAYVTEWTNEEFFSVDLRVHNGMCNLDPNDPRDDAMTKLYFEDLELRVPSGWRVLCAFDSPGLVASHEDGGWVYAALVPDLAGNRVHVIPRWGQMHRRLIVVKNGSEARALAHVREEGRAFCRAGSNADGEELFSWFRADTGRYFPQSRALPTLDEQNLAAIRQSLSAKLTTRSNQLATGGPGSWPAESGAIGWMHPWLVAFGGMHGGTEISMLEGVLTAASGSKEGYRYQQLRHRMYGDRQPNVLYNLDGDPAQMHQWIVNGPNGPYVPVFMHDVPLLEHADPFGFLDAPTFQVTAVESQGRAPLYESALMSWEPIDLAHLVRYANPALTLAWLGNDELAKDDLRMQAEIFRFTYHWMPNNSSGYRQITGLAEAQVKVAAHPGEGFNFGRREGWGLHVSTAVYAMADDEWRERAYPWYAMIVDLVDQGQMDCTGIIQNQPFAHLFDAQYRCRQSIEANIVENALMGIRETVYRGRDVDRTAQISQILASAFYSMITPPVWNPAYPGPEALMATAPMDLEQPAFCTYVPPDGTYGERNSTLIWSSIAYAFEQTHDPLFLTRASQILGGPVEVRIEDTLMEDVGNRATLLGLVQHLP